jgi:hypothetical protein
VADRGRSPAAITPQVTGSALHEYCRRVKIRSRPCFGEVTAQMKKRDRDGGTRTRVFSLAS